VLIKREASFSCPNLSLCNRLVRESQKGIIRRAIIVLQIGSSNDIPVVSFSISETDCHLKFLQYRAHFESEYDKGVGGISSWLAALRLAAPST
jgi:hypothetical protein